MSDMGPDDDTDWMDDESLSFDDAHAKFAALGPMPTLVPELPSAATLVSSAPPTYGGKTFGVTPGHLVSVSEPVPA